MSDMSVLLDAVCTAAPPAADSEAAEILNLLREHREAPGPGRGGDATVDDDCDDPDDDAPHAWTREDDELLRRLTMAQAGSKPSGRRDAVRAPPQQLNAGKWRDNADHYDETEPAHSASGYQKYINPESVKGNMRHDEPPLPPERDPCLAPAARVRVDPRVTHGWSCYMQVRGAPRRMHSSPSSSSNMAASTGRALRRSAVCSCRVGSAAVRPPGLTRTGGTGVVIGDGFCT